MNTRSLGQDCKTLIINGLNPDPGVAWAEPMLLTHLDNLKAGLDVLRRLSPAEKILLAVPKEMRLHYHDIEVVHVPAWYPASVNALMIKAVTGEERPEGVGIVGLHNVWSLGRVARTGLPLIETVLTMGSYTHSGNYIVKEGSTIGELLAIRQYRIAQRRYPGARRPAARGKPGQARSQRHQGLYRRIRGGGRDHPAHGRAQPLYKLRSLRADLPGPPEPQLSEPQRRVRSA